MQLAPKIALVFAATLVACGGGGADFKGEAGSKKQTPQPPAAPPPTPVVDPAQPPPPPSADAVVDTDVPDDEPVVNDTGVADPALSLLWYWECDAAPAPGP